MPVAKLIMWLSLFTVLIFAALVVLAEYISSIAPSQEVAYVSAPEVTGDIYLMDIGHNLSHNLTRTSANELDLAWSPDGTRLAFSSNRNRIYNVYILRVLDGELQQITAALDYNVYSPVWSPDGQQLTVQLIPLQEFRTVICTIAVVTMDTRCIRDGAIPDWSPDGSQFAFYKYSQETGDVVLHVSEADGGNDRALTADLGGMRGLAPAWSPDGRQIAYSFQGDLYVMNADGSNPHVLVDYGGYEYNMTWAEDGRTIVFQSDRDGQENLYLMDITSGTIRRLTSGDTMEYSPAWRP